MNRAQQAYYLENRTFADEIGQLELGLADSENYSYAVQFGGDAQAGVLNLADPTGEDLKSYAGVVWLGTGGDGNATTLAKLCESDSPQADPPDCPIN